MLIITCFVFIFMFIVVDILFFNIKTKTLLTFIIVYKILSYLSTKINKWIFNYTES